jgi:hypothetical protein
MTHTWMGDDFFHQGAFRQLYALGYAWGMERPAEAEPPRPPSSRVGQAVRSNKRLQGAGADASLI